MPDVSNDPKLARWLLDRSRLWVQAGLISPEQADAIRCHEQIDRPLTSPRLTTVAEVAVYLGSIIAIAGGAAIVAPSWDRLGFTGQLVLASTIATVTFAVGAWLVRLADPSTLRLGWFLWVAGAGGAAMAAVVVTNRIDPQDDAWTAVIAGGVVAALGLVLWRNLDRPLQLATAVAGLVTAGAGSTLLLDPPPWIVAVALQAGGLLFGAGAARGAVRPRTVALMLAAGALVVGALLYADTSQRMSAIVAAVSAGAIVAFALARREWAVLALGLLGFVVATMMLMAVVLDSTPARVLGALAGLVAVAWIALRAQHLARTTSGQRRV